MQKRPPSADTQNAITHDPIFVLAQLVLFLKITLVVVAFDPFAEDAFGLVKSVLSHVATLMLVSLMVWLLFRHGRAAFPWSPVHLGAAALVVSFALATPLALDQTTALFGTTRRYLGLTQMLDAAATYAAAFMLIVDSRARSRLLAVVIGAVLVADAFGLLQHAGLDPIRYERFSTVRPIVMIGNPDTAGAYLAVAAVLSYATLIHSWARLTVWGRIGLGVVTVISAFVAVTTETRVTFLVLVAGLPMPLILLSMRKSDRSRSGILFGVAAAVALGISLILAPIASRERLAALLTDPGPAQERLEIYATALRLTAGRSILGLGPDNFAVGYPAARSEASAIRSPELENSTHDWLLYLATSAGLIGVASGVLFVVFIVVAGIKAAGAGNSAALAFVAVAMYMVQGLINPTDIGLDWILWTGGGVIATASVTRGPSRALISRSASALIGALLVLAAALAALPQLNRIEGSERLSTSKALAQRNRGLDAVSYARDALQIDPRRGVFWSGFGTALSVAGNPSAAESAFTEAAQREPWQPLYWRNIGLARLQQGKTDPAIDSLQRAVEADPYDAPSHAALARLLYSRGDYERAAQEGERRIRLVPSDIETYDVTYGAYVQLARFADAERLLVGALRHVNSAHLHVLLARLYANTGRRTEAANQVALALAIEPTRAEALELRNQLTP